MAAKLIWTCWRYREMQKSSRRPMNDVKAPTAKRPLRHLARFILLGIYSGTRAGAIAAASPIPALGRSYVDLERGRYYRRRQGSAKTNKRQPTVPIPQRLLAHLRRWHRIDPETKHFVEFNGKPVNRSRRPFKSAVRLAGLGSRNITSHIATHGGNLAYAEGRGSMAGRRLSWNVAGGPTQHLRPPSPPTIWSDAVEKIAMREPGHERKAHVSGAVSGAVIPLRRNNP